MLMRKTEQPFKIGTMHVTLFPFILFDGNDGQHNFVPTLKIVSAYLLFTEIDLNIFYRHLDSRHHFVPADRNSFGS